MMFGVGLDKTVVTLKRVHDPNLSRGQKWYQAIYKTKPTLYKKILLAMRALKEQFT